MTPTDVPARAHGHAVRFAENQDEYETLPAWYTDDSEGAVITRWRLTWRERLGLLIGKPLWLYIWTFGRSLQPILPTLNEPTSDPPLTPAEPSGRPSSALLQRLRDAGLVVNGTYGPIFDAVAIDAMAARLTVGRLTEAMSEAYTSVGNWSDFAGDGKDPIVRAFAEAVLARLADPSAE